MWPYSLRIGTTTETKGKSLSDSDVRGRPVGGVDEMLIPECTVCGGTLKPEVVFFGEFVPNEKFLEASSLIRTADALVIKMKACFANMLRVTRGEAPLDVVAPAAP